MVKMGTVWDRTAEFLTDNITFILPIALAALFVPLTVMGNLDPVMENASAALSLALGCLLLALAALATWGSLTLIAMALDAERPGATALRSLPAALLMGIVLGVALSLLAAPFVATLAVSSDDGGMSVSMPVGVSVALSIYGILALGVFMWIAARTILLYPVIVAEKRVFGAPLRSWRLTRGVTLQIVGVTLLYGVVTAVAVWATQAVFGSIFRLVAGGAEGGLSLAHVLTTVMVAAVQTGFTMVVPVFTAKLYQALISAEQA